MRPDTTSETIAKTTATHDLATLPKPFALWFAARSWAPRRYQLKLLQKGRAGRSN